MTTATAPLSAEEFAEQAKGTPSVELIRGAVVHLSPGGMGHSRSSFNVAYLLEMWARRTGLGRVLTNELGLITARNPDTVRGADVAYISYARLPKGTAPEGFCAIAPDLVAEVLGKGQGWDTMVAKAAEYLHMGAQRVWVLDPGKRTVHVFTPDQPPQKWGEADMLRDEAVLPGFSCCISEFFDD